MPKISPTGVIMHPPPGDLPKIETDGKRRLPNWLAAFLDYTHQAESPIDYLRWTGIATIAAAAQRKIHMESTLFFVHTNMYVILTGPSGGRKSTAIRQGRKLLKKIPTIHLSPDAPSIVGIMDAFKDIGAIQKDHQSLNAFMWELSSLFENASETMPGFLTAIYDGDDDYIKSTRIGGREHIPYPWLNLIAGTTPSWLGDNLTRSSVEGGLISRILFIYCDDIILKSPFPRKDASLRKLEEDLIHDLAHISQLYGQFDFEGGAGGDAEKWYEAWYLDKSRFPQITDHRTTGYYTRKHIHLLKVAMCVALAERDELVLTVKDMEVALALLATIEPGMKQTFSSVGGNTYATDMERIDLQIRQSLTGLTYGQLLSMNYSSLEPKQIETTLTALIAMGKIEKNGMLYMPRKQ